MPDRLTDPLWPIHHYLGEELKFASPKGSLAAAAVCGMLTITGVAASGPDALAHTTDQQAARGQDAEPAARRPPNVVLFTVDDMMTSDLAVMPHTRRLLARRGTTFTQGIAPTPLCVPSRVSMLTGQYAHNHAHAPLRAQGRVQRVLRQPGREHAAGVAATRRLQHAASSAGT